MPTLLVSGAGLGDSSVLGTTTVVNAAGGALPLGEDHLRFGERTRVSPAARGRDVSFDFVDATTQLGNNVRLDFDPQRPIPVAGIAPPGVGTPSAVNAAQGAFAQGWFDEAISAPRVSADLAGRKVDFDFTLVWTQPASNVGLYFGGQPLVAGVGLKSQTVFGTAALVNAAQAAYPVGIAPLDPYRSVFAVGRGGSIDFNFVLDYTPPLANVVRLDFDPQRPIPVKGLDATLFGTATLTNKALGIFAPGIDSLQVGYPRTSFNLPGRSVDFDFVDPYTPITGINVAFAFGESKAIHGLGWDSLQFGAVVVHIPAFITGEGWDSATFGTAALRAGALRPFGFEDSVFGPETAVGTRVSYTRPYGPDALEMGEHVVTFRVRVLDAVGRNQVEMGRPAIANVWRDPLRPLGFSDEAMGMPALRLTLQFILVEPGPDMLTFAPAPLEADRLRVWSTIGPTQVVAPFPFEDSVFGGDPEVSFWLRRIIFLDTVEMTEWGVPFVMPRVRYIEVPWFYATQMGRPTFGFTPKIKPYPIDEAAVGVPDITLGNVRHLQGWRSSEFGEPSVRGSRRYIVVTEWDEKDSVSQHEVHNLTQIVYVDNKQYFDYVPYFGGDTAILNRNRHITPDSWASSRFPNTHRTRLTGQQTLPTAGDQTLWGEHMVAFRVRHIYPDTRYFFAGFVDPYHFVHNNATRLYPVGVDSARFGLHRTWFNAQYIAPRFIQQDGYGKPFIADRIRWLQQYESYWGEAFGTPWISNYTRTVVQKPYVVPYGFGTPILRTHRNLITVFPIAFNLYGRPQVRNVTPQIYPTPWDQSAHGLPWVSHAPRSLLPAVVLTTTIGEHQILFRTRYVYPPGIFQAAIPFPTVRQQYEEQVFTQYIRPGGIDSFGLSFPSLRVYPQLAGWDSQQFGTAHVQNFGLHPYWSTPDSYFQFGIPIIVFTTTITQINKDGEAGAQTGHSKPVVSPQTIWAQEHPPELAVINHPGNLFHPVDTHSNPPTNDLPPWFGTATISTPALQIILGHHRGDGQGVDYTRGDLIGEPQIDNAIRTIYPKGFNAARYGFPTLNHPVKLWVLPFVDSVFGVPTLSTPPEQVRYLRPPGIDPSVVPKHEVQNWNRNVYVEGFDATIYGNNEPMVYHYPRGPKQAGGWDSQAFSDENWISFYIRYFELQGFDSFEEGYTQGQFEERLRVTREVMPPSYSAGDSLRMGIPTVGVGKGAPQRIGPYMIPPPQYCHPHSIEAVT